MRPHSAPHVTHGLAESHPCRRETVAQAEAGAINNADETALCWRSSSPCRSSDIRRPNVRAISIPVIVTWSLVVGGHHYRLGNFTRRAPPWADVIYILIGRAITNGLNFLKKYDIHFPEINNNTRDQLLEASEYIMELTMNEAQPQEHHRSGHPQ
ncbi:hypothetical protein F4777DRAFT_582093 [Nemania sp. FL0916]|nr:hypothetical protein F4777DRAFT_582093 [Nemania sp. FL0916]